MDELIFFPIDKDNPGNYISGCGFIGGIYLHGKLEDRSGYDLVQADAVTRDELDKLEDGVYDVCVCLLDKTFNYITNVVSYNFKSPYQVVKSKLFFWKTDSVCTRKQFRGLIVSVDDKESLEDAKEKFDARSFWL